MSGRALAVGTLSAVVDRERFAARLVAAVRPEFAAEVIVSTSGDVVLGTPLCGAGLRSGEQPARLVPGALPPLGQG